MINGEQSDLRDFDQVTFKSQLQADHCLVTYLAVNVRSDKNIAKKERTCSEILRGNVTYEPHRIQAAPTKSFGAEYNASFEAKNTRQHKRISK